MTTESIMVEHQCTECCSPNCSLKGTICLQENHEFSVVITNFPVSRDHKQSTPEMLHDFFSQCGRIVAIRTTETSTDPDTLEALITFHDKKAAEKAMEFNNCTMFERIIGVHRALDVDISHLEDIPPSSGLTDKIQENLSALKETVVHLSERAHIPEMKEAVINKATDIGNYISNAVSNLVHPQPTQEQPSS